ncbi:hypothetical protein [Streptomyces sp. AC495_CC817]|uniref:hypothetical protein n=1 Tax=Streptomyces sp. AC495_CC817 TaxID=2823900 RepID=UPI001C262CFE|nr:hypothetical protein [Streptomyces sp. AC495_CC817]
MNLTPLEEAAWVYAHQSDYDRQQRFDAAASLSQWGLFSLRQVGAIAGVSHSTVRKLAKPKSDRTGGKFDPECLELLLDIRRRYARGEDVEPEAVAQLADAGTSLGFAARLAGIPESWLRRRYTKAKKGVHDD